MPQVASAKLNTGQRAKALLHERLRDRQAEIQGEILARIHGDGAPTVAADPDYADGLRSAVPAAIDYCLAGTERGEGRTPPIPAALLVQARVAARNRISLDTVLRRYFAGYTLLGDFMVEEAEAAGLRSADLKLLLRALAASFDRLLAAISEEHGRELEVTVRLSSGQRRARLVEGLLAGEPLDAAELGYDFECDHLGVIVKGQGAAGPMQELAKALDCRVLVLDRGEEVAWGWLAMRRGPSRSELERLAADLWPMPSRLAVGEPASGLSGWRLTHRQAKAALFIAVRRTESVTRYADIALLASVLQDDLLAMSLHDLFLAPLENDRDGGKLARETLRAYFAAERNVSSAAVALGVKRHTVTNRLRKIEECLGRSLYGCGGELEAAIRLEEFQGQHL